MQLGQGTRLPAKSKLAIPVSLSERQSKQRIATLLQRKNTFIGTVHGKSGVWQRDKSGGLKMLYLLTAKATYTKEFLPFKENANRIIDAVFAFRLEANLEKQIEFAVKKI